MNVWLTATCLAWALMPGGQTSPTAPSHESTVSAVDEAPKATLRWRSQREDQVYGYIVYRSYRPEGPFRRVSEEIVHVDWDQPGPAREYAYVDRNVTAGTTYHYYLDVIGLDGRKRRFSSVVSRTVDP